VWHLPLARCFFWEEDKLASPLESIRKTIVSADTAEVVTSSVLYANSIVLIPDQDNTTGYMQFGGDSVDGNSGRLRSGERLVISRDEEFLVGTIYVRGGTIGDAVDIFVIRSSAHGDLA